MARSEQLQPEITQIISTVQLEGTEGYSGIMCYGEVKPINECPSCIYLPMCHKFIRKDGTKIVNDGVLRKTTIYKAKFPTAILLK